METRISIAEIENAINTWRNLKPSPDEVSICREARHLADVYGDMIWNKQVDISVAELTAEQTAALAGATAQ